MDVFITDFEHDFQKPMRLFQCLIINFQLFFPNPSVKQLTSKAPITQKPVN